jgi:hypothetical protein
VGHVELVAGNVVSLGSAALRQWTSGFFVFRKLRSYGWVAHSLAFNTTYGLYMLLSWRASVEYFLRIGAESLHPSNNFLRTSSSVWSLLHPVYTAATLMRLILVRMNVVVVAVTEDSALQLLVV